MQQVVGNPGTTPGTGHNADVTAKTLSKKRYAFIKVHIPLTDTANGLFVG